ncbi:MAG: VWA domain-containing protein [Terracidiphilus sp.]
MKRSVITLALGTLLYTCSLAAQTPAPQQTAANTPGTSTTNLKVSANEVTLDMTFHDKKGKIIDDIKPDEVHVYEDGVEQHVNSFKYIQGAQNPAPQAAGTPTAGSIPVDPMRELRLVTLVFEGLDQDGKRFFKQALQDVLSMAPEQNLYFSVMVIDQKLNMVQPFTNDRVALMKSIDKQMMWTTLQYWSASAAIKAQLFTSMTQTSGGDPYAAPGITSNGSSMPSQASIGASVAYRMNKIQYDMLNEADQATREASARASIDALLALVRAQAHLPGRKVVIYFNPSMMIPEIAQEQYQYMIGMANRANITFYSVDPKGLVTYSQTGSGAGALGDATVETQDMSQTGVGQVSSAAGETRSLGASSGVGEVTQSQAQAQETAENGMRSNPEDWLRDLARQTGGVAIINTNDYKAPLRVVMDEVRTYYEAAYDPTITTYDGKFRKISVKIDRPGIEVHTRSGYFALPQLGGGQQVFAYEVPLLNALTAADAPTQVSFSAAADRFSERGPKIEYELTIEAPLKGLTFEKQADGKTAVVDAPMIAVVKDSSGNIVTKFSKDFAVTVDASKVDQYQQGDLIQNFKAELDPGTYSLEAVVMDKKGNKMGVSKSTLTVPAPSPKLAISDVVIVHKTDQVKDIVPGDPFYYPAGQGYPAGKVTPTLDDKLQGGAGHFLPFYFNVYTDPSVKDAPQATMGFYKDGQYLGSAPIALPAASTDGRIAYVAALPGDSFKPGSYQIKLNVTQGSDTAEQDVAFQVQ